jgi:hypothetical protein
MYVRNHAHYQSAQRHPEAQPCPERGAPYQDRVTLANEGLCDDTTSEPRCRSNSGANLSRLREGAHSRDPLAHPPCPLELLRRGRLLGWFAENAATTLAQAGPLLAHAGRNALHIRNFRRTETQNIAGA